MELHLIQQQILSVLWPPPSWICQKHLPREGDQKTQKITKFQLWSSKKVEPPTHYDLTKILKNIIFVFKRNKNKPALNFSVSWTKAFLQFCHFKSIRLKVFGSLYSGSSPFNHEPHVHKWQTTIAPSLQSKVLSLLPFGWRLVPYQE